MPAVNIYTTGLLRGLKPPENLGHCAWADKYLYLPSKGASEPGKYRSDRTPYIRGVFDVLDDKIHEKVILDWSPQMAKTQIALIFIGRTIHIDPAPMLYVANTVEQSQKVSKQRLQPMIDACPVLSERVRPAMEKTSGNTILIKDFEGGILAMTGANSSSGLRSMPVKRLICDETGAWPKDVDKEGDPLEIVIQRTATFHDRKILIISTSGIEGDIIDVEFLNGDQRYFHVPCPFCDHGQILNWKGLIFDIGKYKKEGVYYLCEQCNQLIPESKRGRMLSEGVWIASKPENIKNASFHLSKLYTPPGWRNWEYCVDKHQRAFRTKDITLMKTFTNEILNEAWREDGDAEPVEVKIDKLYVRRELYEKVPPSAGVLFASVDVQDDRLECLVKAWAKDEESYNLERIIFIGNISTQELWQKLDIFLLKTYPHENGMNLGIMGTTIDTGGHHADEAYNFVRGKEERNIFAIKGHPLTGKPVVMSPSKDSRAPVDLYMIGVNAAKDIIMSRLKIPEPGPGYIHLNYSFDYEYCKQMFAERKSTKMYRGRMMEKWEKIHNRNEALDLEVYNLGGLRMFFPDMFLLNEYIDSVLTNTPFSVDETERRYRSKGINDR